MAQLGSALKGSSSSPPAGRAREGGGAQSHRDIRPLEPNPQYGLQGKNIYAHYEIEKISSKGKPIRRLLVLTNRLLLQVDPAPPCDVKSVITVDRIREIRHVGREVPDTAPLHSHDGEEAIILQDACSNDPDMHFRLRVTSANRPNVPPSTFLRCIQHIAEGVRPPTHPVEWAVVPNRAALLPGARKIRTARAMSPTQKMQSWRKDPEHPDSPHRRHLREQESVNSVRGAALPSSGDAAQQKEARATPPPEYTTAAAAAAVGAATPSLTLSDPQGLLGSPLPAPPAVVTRGSQTVEPVPPPAPEPPAPLPTREAFAQTESAAESLHSARSNDEEGDADVVTAASCSWTEHKRGGAGSASVGVAARVAPPPPLQHAAASLLCSSPLSLSGGSPGFGGASSSQRFFAAPALFPSHASLQHQHAAAPYVSLRSMPPAYPVGPQQAASMAGSPVGHSPRNHHHHHHHHQHQHQQQAGAAEAVSATYLPPAIPMPLSSSSPPADQPTTPTKLRLTLNMIERR